MNNIHYASIRNLDISNGEGVGVALFVQGCHFHCYNCFNPDTWDFNGGKEWTPETKEKFLQLADRPYIKRISLLGGEPLADENLNDVSDLVTTIKEKFSQKTIWLYSGYSFEDCLIKPKVCDENIFRALRYKILKNVDVMVDGRYIDSQRDITLKWRGSSNQRVIDTQKSLKENKIVLYCD